MAGSLHKDVDIYQAVHPYGKASSLYAHSQAVQPPLLLDTCVSLDQYSNTVPKSVHRAEFFAQMLGILYSPPSTVFCICAAVHTAPVL